MRECLCPLDLPSWAIYLPCFDDMFEISQEFGLNPCENCPYYKNQKEKNRNESISAGKRKAERDK